MIEKAFTGVSIPPNTMNMKKVDIVMAIGVIHIVAYMKISLI